jgi:hypothetical protein
MYPAGQRSLRRPPAVSINPGEQDTDTDHDKSTEPQIILFPCRVVAGGQPKPRDGNYRDLVVINGDSDGGAGLEGILASPGGFDPGRARSLGQLDGQIRRVSALAAADSHGRDRSAFETVTVGCRLRHRARKRSDVGAHGRFGVRGTDLHDRARGDGEHWNKDGDQHQQAGQADERSAARHCQIQLDFGAG